MSLIDRGTVSWDQPYWRDEHASSIPRRNLDQSELSTSSGGISSPQLAQLIQNAVKEYASHGLPGEVGAFLDFVKSHFPPLRNIQVPGTSNVKGEKIIFSFDTLEEDIYLSVRKEMHENMHSKLNEDENLSKVASSLVTEDSKSVLHVKYIAALSRELAENHSTSESAHNVSMPVESLQPTTFNEIDPVDCDGIYLSSCGHAVHQGCLDRYLSSLKERYSFQQY